MKKFIAVIALVLLVIATFIPQTGCGGESEVAGPVPSESNRWLELLSILPENEVTLKAAYLQTSEYGDIIIKQFPEEPEGSIMSAELIAHNNLPLFAKTSYTDEEWKETVGFTVKDVTESLMASSGPPSEYQAVRGNFTAEDIEYAARNGPLSEHLEVVSYKGYEFYSWGEDRAVHLDWRSGVRNLGRGHRLAYVDGFALWVLWTDGIEEMIDSYEGNIPSLADNGEYRQLAAVLEDMGTVTACFSTDSVSISEFMEIFHENFKELREKGQEQQIEEFENEPLLKAFSSFAAGAGEDEQGTYLVIVLLNPDESNARANVDLLERRINESQMLPYVTSPQKPYRKWTDNDRIESMEIYSEGRLTVAKLYGPVYTNWDGFTSVGRGDVYLPLLLHE